MSVKWVAVGNASSSEKSILWSPDGLTWNNASSGGFIPIFAGTIGNGIAYDGRGWVAVGGGSSPENSILWSTNGTDWHDASSGGFTYNNMHYGFGIAYGNGVWVAVGSGSSPESSILWSTNGTDWHDASGGGFRADSSGYYGTSIVYDGIGTWVATGGGTSPTNSILWSTNGLMWHDASSGGFYDYSDISDTSGNNGWGIAYGNGVWVAVGSGSSPEKSILWSTNGLTWHDASSGGFSGDSKYLGSGIAYDGNGLWVAVGCGSSPEKSILWSTNGTDWHDASNGGFALLGGSYGKGIAYNGLWIATGSGPSAEKTILWSTNGKEWYDASSGGFYNGDGGDGYGVASTRVLNSLNFTDTSGNTYDTSDVSGWNTSALLALELSLTNESTQIPIYFQAPPSAFLPSNTYAAFLSTTPNPVMIAYPVNPTTDTASCTILTINSNNYAANKALFFPVSTTVSIVLTDNSTYIVLTEDSNGFLCTQPFNNNTKTVSGSVKRVSVGSTYTVGSYTLMNYGIYGASVSGVPQEPLPCFLKGTRILTPTGYKKVEDIESGDLIQTSDKRAVKATLYRFMIETVTEETAPYCIPIDFFGPGLPNRDLHISGNHAIKDMKGFWQIPRFLAKTDPRVQQYHLGKRVTYYHVACPNYRTDNLIAEGVTAESFNQQRLPTVWTKKEVGYIRKESGYIRKVSTKKVEKPNNDIWWRSMN